jgi:hypothetical protein
VAETAAPASNGARALRGTAGLLGLLLFVTYAYFIPAPAWNETSRFNLVRSLVERGRLDIDPFHQNTGDKAFRDGHHYSDKAPGASLLAAPVYAAYYGWLHLSGREVPAQIVRPARPGADEIDPWAGEGYVLFNPAFRRALYVCNLFTNALAGAALGALFFLVLAGRGVPLRLALASTLALALGSLVFPYATMFYGHVLAAAFLFGAFFLLEASSNQKVAAAHGPPGQDATESIGFSGRKVAAAGALAGLAVATELPAAIGTLVLGLYAASTVRKSLRLRALALFFAGALPPLLVLAGYHTAAFGSPLRSGYSFVATTEFAEGMSRGLFGIGVPRPSVLLELLFGRARGLLYVAPVLVLGLIGLVRGVLSARGGGPRREMAAAGLLVLGFLIMNAGYYMWWGGAALGPRHLIPALPFACLGIPQALPATRRRLAYALLLPLLVVSVGNQLVATAVSPLAPVETDVLRDHVWAHFLAGRIAILPGAANGGMLLGLRGPASLLPLLAVWLLAFPSLVASTRATTAIRDPG